VRLLIKQEYLLEASAHTGNASKAEKRTSMNIYGRCCCSGIGSSSSNDGCDGSCGCCNRQNIDFNANFSEDCSGSSKSGTGSGTGSGINGNVVVMVVVVEMIAAVAEMAVHGCASFV